MLIETADRGMRCLSALKRQVNHSGRIPQGTATAVLRFKDRPEKETL